MTSGVGAPELKMTWPEPCVVAPPVAFVGISMMAVNCAGCVSGASAGALTANPKTAAALHMVCNLIFELPSNHYDFKSRRRASATLAQRVAGKYFATERNISVACR